MPKTPDGEPEVVETESDANFIEDMMNMTVNLDRLPNEMIASFNTYDWKGIMARSPNQSQLSETNKSLQDLKPRSQLSLNSQGF